MPRNPLKIEKSTPANATASVEVREVRWGEKKNNSTFDITISTFGKERTTTLQILASGAATSISRVIPGFFFAPQGKAKGLKIFKNSEAGNLAPQGDVSKLKDLKQGESFKIIQS